MKDATIKTLDEKGNVIDAPAEEAEAIVKAILACVQEFAKQTYPSDWIIPKNHRPIVVTVPKKAKEIIYQKAKEHKLDPEALTDTIFRAGLAQGMVRVIESVAALEKEDFCASCEDSGSCEKKAAKTSQDKKDGEDFAARENCLEGILASII